MAIGRNEARAAAEGELDRGIRASLRQPVSIDDGATQETADVFVFFYNTVAFLETGDLKHALAGNGPVIVDRATGACRVVGSGRPWTEQLP